MHHHKPHRHFPKNWYSRLVALAYDPFMRRFEERILQRYRKQLLGNLQGKILEVGAGTGVNFSLYPAEAEVWAIEPSPAMLQRAKKKLEAHPPQACIHLHLAGVEDPVLEELTTEGGFDAIVFTLVLCTIPDPEKAISNARRWLKPDGEFVLLEHIGSAEPASRRWQNILNPFWTRFVDGCNLNRDTDQLLRNHGFIPDWEYYFVKGLPFYVARGRFATGLQNF